MTKKHTSKAPNPRRKKISIVIGVIASILLISVIAGYFLLANKLGKILPGNPIDAIVKNENLKNENGHTNFLIFGTSYDDPDPSHTGGYLTDSLIVLSLDQNANKAYIISVPRDLWVNYGMDCEDGETGRINATYACAVDTFGESQTDRAGRVLSGKIGDVLGLDIHYQLEVNYTFIRSLTDALGGVEVDVYSDDKHGIYDPAVNLKLPAGVNRLDGETALKLARARNSHGGYGLSRSNFDREINQQRIVAAIFKKASADGTLNDPGDVIRLLDALGGQVRTNVRTSELKDVARISRSLPAGKITSVPLTDYVTIDDIGGQSIVRPEAGLYDYSAIHDYITDVLDESESE